MALSLIYPKDALAYSTPELKNIAARIARNHGINPAIFQRQIGAESGWNINAHSPAGAEDIAQFIPSTAKAYGVTLGDNNPIDDLRGAATMDRRLLDQNHGSWRAALSAYNSGSPTGWQHISETSNYVREILGGSSDNTNSTVPTPAAPSAPTKQPALPGINSDDLKKSILANYLKSVDPDSTLLKLGVLEPSAVTPAPRVVQPTPTDGPAHGQPHSDVMGSIKNLVHIAPGANRPGVNLSDNLLSAVRRVAVQAGEPLTIGTGSNHNRLTVNGNVSDHWDGNAADIPATGRELTHLGFSALRAFGVPRDEARRMSSGGLYNLQWKGHRVQVIFKTNEGGNHWNHLHVGVR